MNSPSSSDNNNNKVMLETLLQNRLRLKYMESRKLVASGRASLNMDPKSPWTAELEQVCLELYEKERKKKQPAAAAATTTTTSPMMRNSSAATAAVPAAIPTRAPAAIPPPVRSVSAAAAPPPPPSRAQAPVLPPLPPRTPVAVPRPVPRPVAVPAPVRVPAPALRASAPAFVPVPVTPRPPVRSVAASAPARSVSAPAAPAAPAARVRGVTFEDDNETDNNKNHESHTTCTATSETTTITANQPNENDVVPRSTTTTTTTTTSNTQPPPRPRPSLRDSRGGLGRSVRQSLAQIVPPEVRVPPYLLRWPRTFACCFGILIPLVLIITVSLVVGMLLGKLEMQHEIDTNDAVVRTQVAELTTEQDLELVLRQMPTLCLALLVHNNNNETNNSETNNNTITNTVETLLPRLLQSSMTDYSILEAYLQIGQEAQRQREIPGGLTVQEMSDFFAKCGATGAEFRVSWRGNFEQFHSMTDATQMTFNYIRCVNRSSPLAFNLIIYPTDDDIHDAQPATQTALYEESWRINQRELEAEYLNQGNSELDALTKSYLDATGGEKCAINVPSAAWFWFTVMSTVGYGNQVPISFWGRFMTYTLGLVSILLFGGVLATAGSITTHLLNDLLHRLKRRVPRYVKVLVWGTLWALWMVVLTYQAVAYQTVHKLEPLSWNDGYWLSYISTTTVGFGDFYLQPEGLFVSDLLGLWGTFLIGFVLVSSFLTELSQLLGSTIPNLGDDLQRKLKYAYDQENPEEALAGRRNYNPHDQDNDDANRPWSHLVLGSPQQLQQDTSSRPPSRMEESAEPIIGIGHHNNPDVEASRGTTPDYSTTSAPKPPNTSSPEIIEVIEYVDDSDFEDGDETTMEVVEQRPSRFSINPRDVGIGVSQ